MRRFFGTGISGIKRAFVGKGTFFLWGAAFLGCFNDLLSVARGTSEVGSHVLSLVVWGLVVTLIFRARRAGRETERVWRDREEQLRDLMRMAPVGMFRTDANGGCIYVNDHWTRIAGISSDEAVGTGWANAIHPEDYEKVFQEWKLAFEERRPFELIYRFITASGQKWVHGRSIALTDANGAVVGFFGAIQDITESKAAEEELSRQHGRIRALYELASDSNLSVERHIEHALALGCEWFGMQLGVLSLQRADKFFAEAIYPADSQLQPGAEVNLVDERWVTTVGSSLALGNGMFFSLNFFSSEERASHFTRSDEDIIQLLARWVEALLNRREAERLIRDQQAIMASTSKMSALGEMAGGIAHEVNNPLAIISGNAEMLGRIADQPSLMDPMQIRKVSEKIRTTCARIARIIQGLRSFARDTDQAPVEPISLRQIVDDTLAFCHEKFRNECIEVRVGAINESLQIRCRPSQISQVLLNLLNNAHDAIEPLAEKWIEIEACDAGDNVELRVRDCGSGIPDEIRDKILQPFFTTKAIGKGTGLGLSISKGIIDSHGGTLQVDNGDAHTCFVIILPKEPLARGGVLPAAA